MSGNGYDEEAASNMAESMGKNATEEDIQNVADKMDSMNRGPLAKIWDKVVQLWEAFKDPKTPAAIKALIIGGLIYMVSPIDLIPDPIPILGLTDDVGVIGLVFSQFIRFAGTVAITSVAIYAINIVVKGHLTRVRIKEELKRKMMEEEKKELSAKIKELMPEAGTVKIGLYDENDNETGTASIKADSISDDLYEGEVIQLYA